MLGLITIHSFATRHSRLAALMQIANEILQPLLCRYARKRRTTEEEISVLKMNSLMPANYTIFLSFKAVNSQIPYTPGIAL